MKLNISPAKNSNHESLTTVSNITPFDNSKAGIFDMIKEKKCTVCKVVKPLHDFHRRNATIDGHRSECKKCGKEYETNKIRSKIGLAIKIYKSQRNSSRVRDHKYPTYSKEKFIDFALKSTGFNILYDRWANTGYNKNEIPSFDRKDDSKGYSFDNFNKWMTWKENENKSHEDMRNGILINGVHPQKKVRSINTITKQIEEFCSVQDAGRKTNTNPSDISKCCIGKRKTAGGYIWKHK